MNMNELFIGHAPPVVDYCLAILFSIAGLAQWVQIAFNSAGKLFPRYLVAFGWTLWATRMWFGLAVGNDPFIPPVAAMAISLIAAGNILINMQVTRK